MDDQIIDNLSLDLDMLVRKTNMHTKCTLGGCVKKTKTNIKNYKPHV